MQQPHEADDIAIVDRRREPRIILSVPARYALTDRRDVGSQDLEFDCRIVNLSLKAMALVAPVTGPIGTPIVVLCDEFGMMAGAITRLLELGFVMSIDASDEERRGLAAKIEVYEKIKNHDFSDRRANKRIIPKDPRSVIIFADNTRAECSVIDISTSGVAVRADVQPAVGTPLAIGKMIGRVVRHIPGGFAVHFIQTENIDEHKL